MIQNFGDLQRFYIGKSDPFRIPNLNICLIDKGLKPYFSTKALF